MDRHRSINDWSRWVQRFLQACEQEMWDRLVEEEERPHRIATCDVLYAVRKKLKIRDDILEWRLRHLLCTAHTMGAFDSTPFTLRRGAGWIVDPQSAPLVFGKAA